MGNQRTKISSSRGFAQSAFQPIFFSKFRRKTQLSIALFFLKKPNFFGAIFIDFGTTKLLAKHVNYNTKSTFSSFQKVIILAHCWPPKMSPKAQKSLFFELLQLLIFMFFLDVRFWKTLQFLRQMSYFWGFRCSLCFLKILDFSCFFKWVILDPSGAHFFRFWSILGTSKIDPDPSKTMKTLQRGCIPWKINVFQ